MSLTFHFLFQSTAMNMLRCNSFVVITWRDFYWRFENKCVRESNITNIYHFDIDQFQISVNYGSFFFLILLTRKLIIIFCLTEIMLQFYYAIPTMDIYYLLCFIRVVWYDYEHDKVKWWDSLLCFIRPWTWQSKMMTHNNNILDFSKKQQQ